MDDLINFNNFSNAMLTLTKCATADNWRSVYSDCSHNNPFCEQDTLYCGPGDLYTNLYFISFELASIYFLSNIFVLALIE
jgi:hypothetical protein